MGDEKLLKEIGIRINRKRKEMGITQEALAEKMEVSLQMISNLELGKKAIRPENLIKLCKALNVSTDYILLGELSDKDIGNFEKKYSLLKIEDRIIIERLIERLL